MINGFSVASSQSAAGAATAATTAITLHFNYNNNNSKNNKNINKINGNDNANKIHCNSNTNKNNCLKIYSGHEPMSAATTTTTAIITATAIETPAATTITTGINEHKSHKIINITAPVTTAKMFKITQGEVDTKHFIMAYPKKHHQQQQPQRQQQKGIAINWLSSGKSGKVNLSTSASTKESSQPQRIQVSNVQSSNIKDKQQSPAPAATTVTARAISKSAFIEVLTMSQQQQHQQPEHQQHPQQQKQRTEDQENAFRQIEDVHNYAKLQTDDGGEVEDDEDDDEGEDDDEEDTELHVHVDDDDDHDIIIKQTHKKHNANVPISSKQGNDEDSEEHVEVDVVTVPPALPQQQQEQQMQMLQQSITVEQYMRPEHHARRPMNAFLIFCKRHRAIVKERYKSLENRAITKILGDWWAALDELEKQCFTDLAQQNKDAFFNANPNFKWYKLPAPPLRTLATRPSNAATTQLTEDQQQQQLLQQQQQQHQQQQLHWESTDVAFKFADETQMGELSALLSGSNKGSNSQYKDYALQQALSETSQFMSHAMPCKTNNNNNNNRNNSNKRTTQVRVVDSASNSSEEGERGSPSKKMKTSRSCKGKIYQELINSGQLAAVAKKSNKCRLNSGGSGSGSGTLDANSNTPPISPTTAPTDCQLLELALGNNNAAAVSNNCDVNVAAADFDLEERIKELPALSLDSYLQRKRSTKKKKKFTSSKKVRNSNSSSSATGTSGAITTTKGEQQQTPRNSNNSKQIYEVMRARAAAAAAAAVGSQKRKARKESITRRDVSAIELEVASILPLTINGCYYFNQSQVQSNSQPATVTTTATTAVAIAGQENSVLSSPLSSSSSSSASVYEQANYDVTSTSDLLILAEVAANSTELSNSN